MRSARHGYVALPDGWERVSSDGPGPFVTSELLRDPDGRLVRWRSRAHRRSRAGLAEGVWWRPDSAGWWMGVLFALGSTCFALAAIVSQWASVPRPGIGVTYFAGSIPFTMAAYLQFRETVNVERLPRRDEAARRPRLRPASWEPRRIDWLASAIQLAGTVFFNVSTFQGMKKGLDARQSDLRVWAPDVFGSVCFLLAGALAYAEVCHRWVCVKRHSLSWRIVTLNLVGSVAFGVSAVASLIQPSTSEPVSAAIANAGTAIGALCFLAGAVLLLPESAHQAAPVSACPEARAVR